MPEQLKEISVGSCESGQRFKQEHFPNCPECGMTNGFINAGESHFGVCDVCRTFWCIGCGLFTVNETEEEQKALWDNRGMDSYREVEPLEDLYCTCGLKLDGEDFHHGFCLKCDQKFDDES